MAKDQNRVIWEGLQWKSWSDDAQTHKISTCRLGPFVLSLQKDDENDENDENDNDDGDDVDYNHEGDGDKDDLDDDDEDEDGAGVRCVGKKGLVTREAD